jgi:hypothetical protein
MLLTLAAALAESGWTQDKTVNLTHGDRSRSYLLHLPTGYDSTVALPLVLDFHGLSGTSSQQAGFSGFRAQADKAKFLVAWPQGIGNSWNAGACCGTSQSEAVDDVAFAKAVVAHLFEPGRHSRGGKGMGIPVPVHPSFRHADIALPTFRGAHALRGFRLPFGSKGSPAGRPPAEWAKTRREAILFQKA